MRRAIWLTTAAAAVLSAAAASAQEAQPAPAADGAAAAVTAGEGVTVFTPDFFAASQPYSAMDMVSRVPGFSFDDGDSVRGFGGAAGNVLIDGQRPASKSEPLEETLRRIPATQIERVELIRGGAPGIDMQGRPVVVNVVRRADARGTTLFAVASAFHQDGRTTPAMRFEGARPLGEGRRVEWSALIYSFVDDGAGEGPRQRRDGGGTLIRDAWSDETGGGHGGTFSGAWQQPLAGGRLNANGRLQLERYDWSLEDAVFAPAPGALQVVDANDNVNGELGANWERALGERTRLELVGLQRVRDNAFVSDFDDGADAGRFAEDSVSGESIARAVLRHARTPTWAWEAGGEVAFNYLDSATSFTLNGAPVTLPAANVRVEELRGEAFATSTWRPNGQWALEAGLRAETSTITQSGDSALERSFFYPKPRVLLTWSPGPRTQLRLRLEREVGQLDFGDFVSQTAFSTGVVTAGNAELRPDQTWVLEAAWERRFWDEGALVVTVRRGEITDVADRVPVFTPTDVFDAPGNIGDGVAEQLAVDLTLPLGRLGISGGLLRFEGEWSRSEVTDPTTGERRRMSGQQPFDGELRFSQDLPARNLQWGVDTFFGFEETYWRFDQVDTLELETWVTAYAEWKPRPDLSLRVEAHNLTGRNLIRTREVYAGPRNTSPLAFIETRDLNYDPFIYFRVRKTWG